MTQRRRTIEAPTSPGLPPWIPGAYQRGLAVAAWVERRFRYDSRKRLGSARNDRSSAEAAVEPISSSRKMLEAARAVMSSARTMAASAGGCVVGTDEWLGTKIDAIFRPG